MSLTPSKTHASFAPGKVRTFSEAEQKAVGFDAKDFQHLSQLGVNLPAREIAKMANIILAGQAMDSTQNLITTASVPSVVQFLQEWLPGFVAIITAARRIDDLIGMSVVGDWEDEQVVQGILEVTGSAIPYGDYTNVPRSSWNLNFETRSIVRFEEGLQVGRLEEMRSSKVRVNSGESKRQGAAAALEIQRNAIGFYGYNNGANKTYGFLNDPALPSYVPVAATGTGSSTLWADKNFLQICADLRTAFIALRTQSKDMIDPMKVPTTLALPTDAIDYLTVTADFNISVRTWLKENYPLCRPISAPELNSANGGQNVFYLYADSVSDGMSTDDSRIWIQPVPSKFMLVGVSQQTKGYEESYSNATAGVMLKRPYGVVRYTHI